MWAVHVDSPETINAILEPERIQDKVSPQILGIDSASGF